MGRRKSVAQLERELLYARNKANYTPTDRPAGTTTRRLPRIAYAYKPMVIAADAATTKRYKVQASQEGVNFFTAAALNLVASGAEDPLPRGARPAKVHATVADGSPQVVKAVASKRPYVRYGRGTRGSNAQYTYTAPISIQSASAIDKEVRDAFTAVKGKLGGAYGRVWFEPEYFVLADGGS